MSSFEPAVLPANVSSSQQHERLGATLARCCLAIPQIERLKDRVNKVAHQGPSFQPVLVQAMQNSEIPGQRAAAWLAMP